MQKYNLQWGGSSVNRHIAINYWNDRIIGQIH